MNVQEMMRQARQMQERMEQLQEKLKDMEVTGESGGGMVKIVMTCGGETRHVEISPEVINSSDKETLEDLVKAAMNMTRQAADATAAAETARMMQDMGLPSNFELPKF